MEIKFKLLGAVCDACYKLSAKRLEKIDGFMGLEIDTENNRLKLISNSPVNLKELNEALKETDFTAELI